MPVIQCGRCQTSMEVTDQELEENNVEDILCSDCIEELENEEDETEEEDYDDPDE